LISIALISLLMMFNPLISLDRENLELRKEVKKKQIIINKMEIEYAGKSRTSFNWSGIRTDNSNVDKHSYKVALFNEVSTYPREIEMFINELEKR